MRAVLLTYCILYTLTMWAQDYTLSRHISSTSGLSNNFVTCMEIDDDGHIWVGTEAGVNRISGNICKEIPQEKGVSDYPTTSLLWNKQLHSIFIGTEFGLYIYHPKHGHLRHLNVQDGLIFSSINDLARAHHGVWIIYGSGQIQFLNDSTLTPRTLALSHPYGNRCAMDDGKGNLYIGHSRHGMTVVKLNSGTSKNYQHKAHDIHSLPGNNVRCIYQDRMHRIWVGTDSGLALFNPKTGRFTRVTDPVEHFEDNVYDIRQMQNGKIWVATDIGDIKVLNPNNPIATDECLHYEPTQVTLSSHNLRSIVEDEYGNIWVGNYSSGVDFISATESDFNLLDYTDNRGSYPPVYALTKNGEDGFWMACEKELVRWQNGQITGRWSEIKRIGRKYIFPRCLMADRSGKVWIGIDDQGAYCFDHEKGSFSHIALSPEGSDIHSFAEDAEGQIWIGGEFGIYLHQNGEAILQEDISREIHAPATSIIQTDADHLFIATLGDGIYSFNMQSKMCQHLNVRDGLPSSKINQTIRNHDGGLWLATDAGLVFLSDPIHLKGLQVYGKESGLADSHIRALQQHRDGSVWMSTYSGISCLVKSSGKIYNYTHMDNHQFDGFSLGGAITDNDGTIYFASHSGVCYFNPNLMNVNDSLSDIQIISCEAYHPVDNNTEIQQLMPDSKGGVYATYKNNTLRMVFTVRNYAQTEQVDYSYKMKGMDDKWYDIEDDNDVVFRGLSPGHYTFILRARLRNQDGSEAKETKLEIYIAPPFWRTWWAYCLYALIALALITFYIRSYKRKLILRSALELERRNSLQKQELNEERLRFFTNITHELRTPLTLILGPLDDLMDDKQLPPQCHRRVAMILKSAERLRYLINEILEFRKTETQNRRLTVARGDIGLFVREICLNYKELYHNPKVQFSYDIPEKLPPIWFDSEIITTILHNFLSNAIKYTEQGSITTTIQEESDGRLSISVTDTGYGITPDALPHIFDRYYQAKDKHQASGTGIGLALVKSLAEVHEAQVNAESREGEGSKFSLFLYISNTYPNALHKEDVEDRQAKEEIGDVPDGDAERDEHDEDARPVLLVVEDNADIRQYIADSFSEDFSILQAENGEEGVQLAKAHVPDIIVSDIMMPKLNGIQLTRQLKDDIRTSHVPIILLTAKNTDENKEEGYDSGADSYLTKPFTAKLLASRIQNLLTARRRLAEYITRSPQTEEKTCHSTASPQLGRLDQEFLTKLNSIIQEHIMTQDIDLPFITDKMAMSHSTFYRKIKALTGMTASEYIRKFRLQHCYHLLESGEYNVNQAAMMTGFNQMAHFRDIFRKEFGILPSEVIKKTKQL